MGLSLEQDERLSSLMRMTQDGDEPAYRRLLEECVQLIRPFAKNRLGVPEHAEDVVQETLLSIHKARHTYNPEKPFAPWMYAIAAHRVADFLRKNIRISQREVSGFLGEEMSMANLAISGPDQPHTLSDDIALAILDLPERQKTVLELLRLEELPVKEVAIKLGMSESAVKVTAFRAYEALRKRFGVKKSAD